MRPSINLLIEFVIKILDEKEKTFNLGSASQKASSIVTKIEGKDFYLSVFNKYVPQALHKGKQWSLLPANWVFQYPRTGTCYDHPATCYHMYEVLSKTTRTTLISPQPV